MENQNLYSKSWFDKQKVGATTSAEVILPIVVNMVSPKSVVDIGCGLGVWLEYFTKNGVVDVLGIDGEWVDELQLRIPKRLFKKENISESFKISRNFDLAMSLEVGEHLSASSAESLVRSLTEAAPVVLFSSAIPGQPGTGHINGQWPEYWAEIFEKFGFIPVDCIRRRVWTNPSVEYWYAQNTILYVRKDAISKYPKIKQEIEHGYSQALPLVHPKRYYYALQPLPSIFFRIRRKIKKILRIKK